MQYYIRSKSVSRRAAVAWSLILLALVAMPLSLSYAYVGGIIIEPEWPDMDELISITAFGYFPFTCWELNGSHIVQSGDTIVLYLHGEINPMLPCFALVWPYGHTTYLDPLPTGSYTLIVYDGTGHSMDTVFYVSSLQCCEAIRGNIDRDPDDLLDISDLVYLVDYMFNDGPPPLCAMEADLTGDGQIDISDLVHIVDYMFNSGLPPADCP